MVLDALPIPIIQAPMLGASGEAMAIAVSNAGGLGSLAAAGLSPDAILKSTAAIRAATHRPFLVNLFVLGTPEPSAAEVESAIRRLRPWRHKFDLAEGAIPNRWSESFKAQLSALIEAAPPAVSFTFGLLTPEEAAALKARGCIVIGTATTVAEAKAWADVGADAICAQGFEAGGHRGTFLKEVSESSIGTLALVTTIRAAVDLPVIAAGGITDGPAIAAALTLGAAAVQLGTAYLLAAESTISAPWRDALMTAGDDATRLTRAFSGRHARGIENDFMRAMRPHEHEIPPYPIQNALTQDLRAAAAKAGSSAELSLWAGQSMTRARPGSAAQITQDLWRDAGAALRSASSRWL